MASTPTIPPPFTPASDVKRRIPPLQQGDRLTRSEFLLRYAAMSENVKAERIEGMVYMPAAAVSAEFHGRPHIHLATWLGTYESATPGVAAADNSTILLDIDNDPQPDLCLYVLPSHGGRIKITPEGYVNGSPDLIVEVAASSMSFDMGTKRNTYRRNGVQEYVVHRTYDGEVDWFVLRDGEYERLTADAEGIVRSETFPGLWLKANALVAGRLAEVLAVLQRGLEGKEHGKFIKKLEMARVG